MNRVCTQGMLQYYKYTVCILLGAVLFMIFGQSFYFARNDPMPYGMKYELQGIKLETGKPDIMFDTSQPTQAKTGKPDIMFDISQPTRGKTRVYRYDGYQFVRLAEFCTWTVHLDCVMLQTPSGRTPIHIHDLRADGAVSGSIKNKGSWEPDNVNVVIDELKKDPELGFMDLGSHVGCFSLSVAKFGRKVVSVDPLVENVQRLCKSIQKGGFTENMTIIFNPLSDSHRMVNFYREATNVGGTRVIPAFEEKNRAPCEESSNSPTAMLDDLLPLIPFRKAVLKMDVQEHEFKVLKGGNKFFKEVNVTAILMEWDMMKNDVSGPNLITLLQGYNFKAYPPSINGNPLDPKAYKSWPNDILWRRQ